MTNEVKISVVVPCYNVEKYIRRGLDSILAQTFNQWEAILVDDGATDNTGKICDEYAQKDRRFQVIHTNNQGLSCARNNGMQQAIGELLYFMDPDDWIEPNCFERCFETYKQYHCDIINFGFWWEYDKDIFTDSATDFKVYKGDDIYNHFTKKLAGFSQNALNMYYKGDFIWNHRKGGFVWVYMFKRTFVSQHNLAFIPGLVIVEDEIFMIEATYKASLLVQIPDVFYHYWQRSDGLLNKKRSVSFTYNYKFKQIEERHRLRKQIKEFDLHDYFLGTNVLSCLKLAIENSDEWKYYKLFNQYVTNPDIQESIKKVSLKNAPLKFAIPVYLLKSHCHLLLFTGCWLAHKLGFSLPGNI